MNLLLDIGNSRCKWAKSDGHVLQQVNAIEYSYLDSTQRAKQISRNIDVQGIEHIHAVSVLGTFFEEQFVNELTHTDITFHASQKQKYGVTLSYDDVSTYGADRYAAVVAGHHLESAKGTDKIVIDCGTATTIDAIDADGHHEGGLIMPGARLMFESLVSTTSGISLDKKQYNETILAENTQQAVYSGCILQLRYGVQGIINQLCAKKNKTILLTGGESDLLDVAAMRASQNNGELEYILKPALLFEGLQIMQE